MVVRKGSHAKKVEILGKKKKENDEPQRKNTKNKGKIQVR